MAVWTVFMLVASLAACDPAVVAPPSDASVDADRGSDGGMDASAADGGTEPVDAARDGAEGGVSPDDADGDGVPTADDCDDLDATIGTNGTRACESVCATGVEVCTSGTWGACSATTDCTCPTPGATRTVACGRCGLASQACGDDGVWGMPSMCLSEGECAAGALETDTSRCGSSARICDDSCTWRPWDVTTPPGECDAGDVEVVREGCATGEFRHRTCTATCAWEVEPVSDCELGCSRPATATEPATGLDLVCIPAGEFVLSNVGIGFVQNIGIHELYVDRNPITRARFDACIAAGGCTAPTEEPTVYASLPANGVVMGATHAEATAFCAWAGGRLPSEFEWEKIARGFAPNAPSDPWSPETGARCDYHPASDCLWGPIAIDAHPLAVSPFGVHLQGSSLEYTRTLYGSYRSPLPDDPEGPDTGTVGYTRRGTVWTGPLTTHASSHGSASRRFDERSLPAGRTMFRCVY